jgi:hypothetical protein
MFNNLCSFIYSLSSASLVLKCVFFSHTFGEGSPPMLAARVYLVSFWVEHSFGGQSYLYMYHQICVQGENFHA